MIHKVTFRTLYLQSTFQQALPSPAVLSRIQSTRVEILLKDPSTEKKVSESKAVAAMESLKHVTLNFVCAKCEAPSIHASTATHGLFQLNERMSRVVEQLAASKVVEAIQDNVPKQAKVEVVCEPWVAERDGMEAGSIESVEGLVGDVANKKGLKRINWSDMMLGFP